MPRSSVTAKCPQCSTIFVLRRTWQKFCTRRCQQEHHRDKMEQVREFYKTHHTPAPPIEEDK